MEKRTACVKNVEGASVAFSSILAIGDTEFSRPISRVIAVQKEGAVFTPKDDVPFTNYDLFTRPAKWLNKSSNVKQRIYHHEPSIHVQQAQFIGVDTSSIFQIGSIHKLSAEARIKHFRILREEDVSPAQST
ncbi:hypothetical protein GCM10011409_16390 [Lentibacillus populi]|uniref:Spore germination protein GerPE n=1 Tax=Lentibacillus populi TaxID=1827502 RepID=A0A9W5TWL4_9BACI|nr:MULTISPECIES: spore germination protein GerPE [Bacillaceae]GGB39598.1 hypothetical protein GCM10011409_16390 [Lentibacillus populi]